jgi:hypothetical protein
MCMLLFPSIIIKTWQVGKPVHAFYWLHQIYGHTLFATRPNAILMMQCHVQTLVQNLMSYNVLWTRKWCTIFQGRKMNGSCLQVFATMTLAQWVSCDLATFYNHCTIYQLQSVILCHKFVYPVWASLFQTTIDHGCCTNTSSESSPFTSFAESQKNSCKNKGRFLALAAVFVIFLGASSRKRRLNGAVLRMRPGKTEAPCHSRCGTIKIPPCSKALSAEYRPTFGSPSPAIWWRFQLSEKFLIVYCYTRKYFRPLRIRIRIGPPDPLSVS